MKNEREPPLPLPLTLGRLPRILHFLAFWVKVEWYYTLLVIWHLIFNISMKLEGFVCLSEWRTDDCSSALLVNLFEYLSTKMLYAS